MFVCAFQITIKWKLCLRAWHSYDIAPRNFARFARASHIAVRQMLLFIRNTSVQFVHINKEQLKRSRSPYIVRYWNLKISNKTNNENELEIFERFFSQSLLLLRIQWTRAAIYEPILCAYCFFGSGRTLVGHRNGRNMEHTRALDIVQYANYESHFIFPSPSFFPHFFCLCFVLDVCVHPIACRCDHVYNVVRSVNTYIEVKFYKLVDIVILIGTNAPPNRPKRAKQI